MANTPKMPLELSLQSFRTLVDSLHGGICSLDSNGKILSINEPLETIMDCSRNEILQHSFLEFILAQQQTTVHSLLEKGLHEPRVGPEEISLQLKDGVIREVEMTIIQINEGEARLIVLLYDMTHYNHLRTQLLLNDKLVTVGTLSAGIVHEINNPTAWILANLNFLKDKVASIAETINQLGGFSKTEDPQKALKRVDDFLFELRTHIQQFSEVMQDSIQGAEQIRDIVKSLKTFARSHSEELELADLHTILDTAIKMAYPEYKYRATLEKNYAKNLPCCLVKPGKLQQVFLNLIVNAAQALPNNNIEKNRIVIKTYQQDDFVCISMQDNGCGIPKELQERIFEPFFTTKPVGIGTGLGLSICLEIIRSMRGDISVESEVGKGTNFTIRLPIVNEQPEQKVLSAHVESSPLLRARILAIDDEPSLLKALQRMLEYDHEVTIALGGKKALAILADPSNEFDLIVSDVNMPDLGGIELYQFVAQERPGLEHRILFITGSLDVSASMGFADPIKNPFLEKPFTKLGLLKAIEELLLQSFMNSTRK